MNGSKTTPQRVRITAAATALTLVLTSCAFIDALGKAIEELIQGGISFTSAGDVNAGGFEVLRGGRTAESWKAKDQSVNQAIENATDQAIADFLMKREQSELANQLLGPSTAVGQLDETISTALPDYSSTEYFLPESKQGKQEVRSDGPPFLPGANPKLPDSQKPRDLNYPIIRGAQSGERVNYTRYALKPGKRQVMTLTTGASAPQWKGKDPLFHRGGATVTVVTDDQNVPTSVSFTQVFRRVPTALDIATLKLADLTFEETIIGPVAQPERETDSKGNPGNSWTPAGFTFRLESKEIPQLGLSAFNQLFEVQFRATKGAVYFSISPPQSVIPKPSSEAQKLLREVGRVLLIDACNPFYTCLPSQKWIDKNYPKTNELKDLAP